VLTSPTADGVLEQASSWEADVRRPPPARQPARAPHRARASGAGAHGRGALQPGHRRPAVRHRAHRGKARQEHSSARCACRRRPTITAGCWRSSPISTRS